MLKHFDGFDEIWKYRNGISHGNIDPSRTNVQAAVKLRIKAKSIVNELFKIAEDAGFPLERKVTLTSAIASIKARIKHKAQ